MDAGLVDVGSFDFTLRQDLLDPVYTLFEETCKKAVPYIISCKENDKLSDEEKAPIYHTWNLLVILLDFLEALLSDRNADATLGANQAVVQSVIAQKPLVKTLVELLHVAQVHLPKISKLSDLVKEMKATAAATSGSTKKHSDEHKKFPFIKSSIICVLGILTMGNRVVQDQVRELQGLELVLSNCIIDTNNPFIKERSVICLKYLLENNQENQDFVRKLEAKSTVTEEALQEAGMETEIIDGKIALKKMKSKSKIEEVHMN